MPPVPEPVLPPSWGDVLDQVQQTLAQALERTDQRLHLLEAAPPAPPDRLPSRSDTARQQLAASVDAAARQVRDADGALAVVEDALRSWLDASAAARHTLADRASRAIG